MHIEECWSCSELFLPEQDDQLVCSSCGKRVTVEVVPVVFDSEKGMDYDEWEKSQRDSVYDSILDEARQNGGVLPWMT